MGQGWGSGGYGPPPGPGGWGPPPGAPGHGPPGLPPPGWGGHAPLVPAPYAGGPMMGPMQCRTCGSAGPHFTVSRVSPVGWVVFGVLFFAFLPLCWVGLFIKNRGLQCGSCRQWVVPPV